MAYGKGPFTVQDKILPGMYVNVVGEAQVGSSVGSRGKAAIALEMNWGNDTAEIVKVTASDFFASSEKMFGYKFSAPEMAVLRQIFIGATEVYVYRLNGEGGVVATAADFAQAKYKGTRGNAISIAVSVNVDNVDTFDVVTMLDNVAVDRQLKVTNETLKDNDYVTFLKSASGFALAEGTKMLAGGTNGTPAGVAAHGDFLAKLEAYQVNAVGCISEDASVQAIYASWVKNQRDIFGNRIQAVLYNQVADHEGVINVDDSVGIVPWVLGKEAGCALNASLQNITYDGEAKPVKSYTQSELEDAISAGKFILHRVGDSFRVLADINSLVNLTGDKTEMFKLNQTIRVVDQLVIDASAIWNEDFIGKVPNTDSGRITFWSRIISLLNEYLGIGAIDEYNKDEVTVAAGTQRGSVVLTLPVSVATMLEKAYVTIVVQ